MTTPAMLYNRAILDNNDDDDSDDEMTMGSPTRRRHARNRPITKTKSLRNVYKKHRQTLTRDEKNKSSTSVDSSVSQSDDGDEHEADDDDSTDSSFLSYCLKNHRHS